MSRQLIGGGPIPQLVMYRKTPRGWVRRVLVGGQSVETVEQFINEGTVVDNGAAKSGKAAEKTKTEDDSKPAEKTPAQPKA